jgi:GNAT superfamily N-acetyltransferase
VLTIERMTHATLPTASRLLSAQLAEHDIELGELAAQRALAGLLDDSSRGFVLLARTSETVGLAVCPFTWTVEHGGQVAWLDELYIVPEHRGRGFGRGLLLQVVEQCRQAGCLAIDLEVDQEHMRAAGLYEREGFVALPRKRYSRRLA